MIWIRLSLKEIFNQKSFFFVFVLTIGIGLSGFVSLQVFRNSFQKQMTKSAREMLNADIMVYARRDFKPDEKEILSSVINNDTAPGFSSGKMMEFYSMVSSTRSSRLMEIRAIDETFPLYGSIELGEGKKYDENTYRKLADEDQILVYPEILTQLAIEIGDPLKIGEASFTVLDVITQDTAQVGSAVSFAPTIMLSLPQLEKTGLVQKGSTIWHSYLYRLSGGPPANTLDSIRDKEKSIGIEPDVEAFAENLFEKLKDPGIRILTFNSAGNQFSRLFRYLSDYLGLVSCAALFLSALGAFFLFRYLLDHRLRNFAIMTCLGGTPKDVQKVFLWQIFFLGLGATFFALGASVFVFPFLKSASQGLTAQNFQFHLDAETISITILIATALNFTICWPLLHSVRNSKPLSLLRNLKPGSSKLWTYFPALFLFFGLSVWQAKSLKIGGAFYISVVASLALLYFIARLLLYFAAKFSIAALTPRLALRQLTRVPNVTILCFLSISLGVALSNFVPQIQNLLDREINLPGESKLPSLFLFDIQEDQIDTLKKVARDQDVQINDLTPLVRARLIKVNGEAFEKGKRYDRALTREEEQEMRSRNRGYNLTYKEIPRKEASKRKTVESGKTQIESSLKESQSVDDNIIDGVAFSGVYQGDFSREQPAEVSIEQRFSRRMSLKLGDLLEFNIQGVPVFAKVVNFRKVRWTTFRPNFFIEFQPGVLDEAPKSYLATVPKMSRKKIDEFQNHVVDALSNVSMIDVTRMVKKMSQVVNQMGVALQAMAFFCLLVGLFVLFAIIRQQTFSRRWDFSLLKILGASKGQLRKVLSLEISTVALFSGLFGGAIGITISFAISQFIFETVWVAEWSTPIYLLFAVTLLSIIVSIFASESILRQKSRLS